jgi:hypothetical protein
VKELYLFCEGATEQGFCKQVLAPHLFPQGDGCIHTIKTAFCKHHGRFTRGGVGKFATLRRDIHNTLKSRNTSNVFFTTLIDLYALPKDFPGKSENACDPRNPLPFVRALESAFENDIGDPRFIPHIQLHEFETMLFAKPEAFRISFGNCDQAVAQMSEIAASFPTIEHIDDGRDTAPSKRIIKVLPAYEGRKPTAGPDIAEWIGLVEIRKKCAHFDSWLARLEQILWT